MRTTVTIIASVALFLLAAKTHGRHLRLERELAGYMTVDFRGTNPPFVMKLWRAEQKRFWPLTLVFGVAVLALGIWRSWPAGFTALAVLLWIPAVSFMVTSGLSALRLSAAAQHSSDVEGRLGTAWLSSALWGSVGWWSLVALMAVVVTFLAKHFFAKASGP